VKWRHALSSGGYRDPIWDFVKPGDKAWQGYVHLTGRSQGRRFEFISNKIELLLAPPENAK